MRFCEHCGAQLSEGSKFCESCGARVEGATQETTNSRPSYGGPVNTNGIGPRNIVVAVILTILTCGIYSIYWTVKLNDELLQMSNTEGTSGGMVILFTILTCGIYSYFWLWKMGACIDKINNKNSDLSTGILFLILAVFGFSFVNYIIAQSTINDHVEGKF